MAILYYEKNGEKVTLNSYKVNNVIVSQEKGQSEADVMSQKAVTDTFAEIESDIATINSELQEKAQESTVDTLGNLVAQKADKTELNDYYKKTETYSKPEVDGMIEDIEMFDCGTF